MQVTKEIFELCQQWQQGGNRRQVNIEIGNVKGIDEDTIWCYDYEIANGFYVKTIEDFNIDLLANKRARLQAELEALNG